MLYLSTIKSMKSDFRNSSNESKKIQYMNSKKEQNNKNG